MVDLSLFSLQAMFDFYGTEGWKMVLFVHVSHEGAGCQNRQISDVPSFMRVALVRNHETA